MKALKNAKFTPVIGLIVGVVIGLICFRLTSLKAGNLEPTAPPAPTMKTLSEVEPRILIPASSTPAAEFTITNPGSYYLAGNRYCSGNGIVIHCNDVTIDLTGFRLLGPIAGTTDGINFSAHSNIEIRNGTIRNFGGYGIIQDNVLAKGNRIIGIRVVSNGSIGIRLEGKSELIENCSSMSNGHMGIATGIYSSIVGNTSCDNAHEGIYAGAYSTVIGNTAGENRGYGIEANIGCTIDSNTICKNDDGIFADTGSTITNNTVRNNNGFGIYLAGDNLVDQNTAVGNGVNIFAGGACTYGVNRTP